MATDKGVSVKSLDEALARMREELSDLQESIWMTEQEIASKKVDKVIDIAYVRRGKEMSWIGCSGCGDCRWFLMIDDHAPETTPSIVAVRCAGCGGQFDLTQPGVMPRSK